LSITDYLLTGPQMLNTLTITDINSLYASGYPGPAAMVTLITGTNVQQTTRHICAVLKPACRACRSTTIGAYHMPASRGTLVEVFSTATLNGIALPAGALGRWSQVIFFLR
jgi:hypothetical protein